MRPDFIDFIPPATCPGKKENPKYDNPVTIFIQTKYGEHYEVKNVHDYGFDSDEKNYWYTTKDNMYHQNYVRADNVLYFGLKEDRLKPVIYGGILDES